MVGWLFAMPPTSWHCLTSSLRSLADCNATLLQLFRLGLIAAKNCNTGSILHLEQHCVNHFPSTGCNTRISFFCTWPLLFISIPSHTLLAFDCVAVLPPSAVVFFRATVVTMHSTALIPGVSENSKSGCLIITQRVPDRANNLNVIM